MSVLVLAVLYFALMGLVLMESTAKSREAAGFHSRIASEIFAENAAELAARQMVSGSSRHIDVTTSDGVLKADFQRSPSGQFTLRATATSSGVAPTSSHLVLRGRISGSSVAVEAAEYGR
ncbi:MAG: hypothetical protein WBX15_12740 [Thermoanaerobaculia bacterium]